MIESKRSKGDLVVTCEPDESGGWLFTAWDRVGSRLLRVTDRKREPTPLPEETIARYEVLEAWERAQRHCAYAIIHDLYPEAKGGMRTKGCIRVLLNPDTAQPQGKPKKGEDRDAEAAPSFAGSGGADELQFYSSIPANTSEEDR